MARCAHLPLTVIVLIAAARIASAQQAAAFTAEDMLEVASIRVLDVSDDGRWIAATVRRPVDNPTTDHRRYGDPSYLAPSRVTLQIIDGRSGAVDVPFEELVNVGDAAWSRDGQQLAILLAREPTTPEGFPATALYVWNAATRSVTLVTLQGPETIEVSSNLAWTPDNRSIVVALRNPELDREARQRFRLLTDGPVVVHASSDPFLEWDALRRSTRSRSVAVIDPRTGAVRAAIPQNRLTSYGGYATVLLITQTDRFKAAINISGKVNMVSFYTDSPRLGVRNTHAPEKSQDRIGGTLWEYPERYLEHSAVLRADRVKTPLLNITGDQDPNVPASQSREMYYALRRLGKEVEWVRYVNGGHRPPNSVEESIDFEQRIVAWYDKYLKKDQKKKDTNSPPM